jgi:hypothetical protein
MIFTWQTEADMHHLWYGRRAVTRIRSLLTAAVYDKAIKRKDFSGAVAVGTGAKAADGGSIQKSVLEQVGRGRIRVRNASPSETIRGIDVILLDLGSKPSAGANIWKGVNLISGDASRVSQIFGNLYKLYGAPFEIITVSVFLYQCVHPCIHASKWTIPILLLVY